MKTKYSSRVFISFHQYRTRTPRWRLVVVMGICGSKEKGKYRDLGAASTSKSSKSPKQNVRRNASARENAWRNTGIVGLRDAGLRELPPKLFGDAAIATAAKNVDASCNRIARLPSSIATLVNLQRLTLARNDLTAIPVELCACVHLKTLTLDDNRIGPSLFPREVTRDELAAGLSALTKLATLSLAGNRVAALPAGMGALRSLRRLNVSRNDLADLPDALGDCEQLEELDASRNARITTVPSTLGALRRLALLNLDDTSAMAIPREVFEGCASLTTLSLHRTRLSSDAVESTPGYEAHRERVRAKHSKKIHGGSLIGSEGLDDGVDRDTSKQNIAPHA
jgi:Leucine-rich repeat (LRR) protein